MRNSQTPQWSGAAQQAGRPDGLGLAQKKKGCLAFSLRAQKDGAAELRGLWGVGVGHWGFTLMCQAGDEVVPQKMQGDPGSEYRQQEKGLGCRLRCGTHQQRGGESLECGWDTRCCWAVGRGSSHEVVCIGQVYPLTTACPVTARALAHFSSVQLLSRVRLFATP